MQNGWIKLHRKMLYNPIAQRPIWAWLWIVLLLKANHEEVEMMWNGGIIKVKEGQFITSRDKLAEASGLSSATVERALKYLEIEHQIAQQKFTKFRLITITNWTEHQSERTPKRTTGDTTDDTTADTQTRNTRSIRKGESEVSDDTKAKIVKFTDKDVEMVSLLTSLIQKNNPAWTIRGSPDTWAEDMNKIYRLDKRTYEQIEYMIRWTQKDPFWSQNILSAAKLRDKFNDLIPKLKALKTNSTPNYVL